MYRVIDRNNFNYKMLQEFIPNPKSNITYLT